MKESHPFTLCFTKLMNALMSLLHPFWNAKFLMLCITNTLCYSVMSFKNFLKVLHLNIKCVTYLPFSFCK